jgi:hypothetical protein
MKHASPKPQATQTAVAPKRATAAAQPVGVPRYLRPAAPITGPRVRVGAPGDRFEQEADRIASRLQTLTPARSAGAPPPSSSRAATSSTVARAVSSSGRPLDASTRTYMESRFGTDLGHVRVHTGSRAETLNGSLGSRAFTEGGDIFYGRGYAPGNNPLTAHELVHVVQQGGGSRNSTLGPVSSRDGRVIQRNIVGSTQLYNGLFELDLMELNFPGIFTGLLGGISFTPSDDAPISNEIGLVQIASVHVDGEFLRPPRRDKDRQWGDPDLTTQHEQRIDGGLFGADKEEIGDGFITDVPHSDPVSGEPIPGGTPASPFGMSSPQGSVGAEAHLMGYKRSNLGWVEKWWNDIDQADCDIAPAWIGERAGIRDVSTATVGWDFQTVALGLDTGEAYGSVLWGFTVKDGKVSREYHRFRSSATRTFWKAVSLHRGFYAHEPVTLYFDDHSLELTSNGRGKLESCISYLELYRDAKLSIVGHSDIRESGETGLSQGRADVVKNALLTSPSVDAARIISAAGSSPTDSQPLLEDSGWYNRKVVISFERPKSPK